MLHNDDAGLWENVYVADAGYIYNKRVVETLSKSLWEYAFRKNYFTLTNHRDGEKSVSSREVRRFISDIVNRVPKIGERDLKKSVFMGREVYLIRTPKDTWAICFPNEARLLWPKSYR